MTLATLRRCAVVALSTGAAVLGVLAVARDASHISPEQAANRRAVIAIMKSLHKGMDRSQAERLVRQHESHFFTRRHSSNGAVYWTSTGGVHAWAVGVQYSTDGKLQAAKVWTEDGPYHPVEVPPDIE